MGLGCCTKVSPCLPACLPRPPKASQGLPQVDVGRHSGSRLAASHPEPDRLEIAQIDHASHRGSGIRQPYRFCYRFVLVFSPRTSTLSETSCCSHKYSVRASLLLGESNQNDTLPRLWKSLKSQLASTQSTHKIHRSGYDAML